MFCTQPKMFWWHSDIKHGIRKQRFLYHLINDYVGFAHKLCHHREKDLKGFRININIKLFNQESPKISISILMCYIWKYVTSHMNDPKSSFSENHENIQASSRASWINFIADLVLVMMQYFRRMMNLRRIFWWY